MDHRINPANPVAPADEAWASTQSQHTLPHPHHIQNTHAIPHNHLPHTHHPQHSIQHPQHQPHLTSTQQQQHLIHTHDTKIEPTNSVSTAQRLHTRRQDDPIDSMLQGQIHNPMFAPNNNNTVTPNLPEFRRPPVLPPPPQSYTLAPLSRPVKDLMNSNPEKMTCKERRRVRVALLSRKRKRSNASSPGGIGNGGASSNNNNSGLHSTKRLALDTAALAAMDKKQLRTIRNRQVALEARQKAKARLQRLESENSSLKSKASTLERENSLLKSQIEQLKQSMDANGAPPGTRTWNGDVSLESVIAP